MLYLTAAAFLIASQATAQPAPSKPQYSVNPQLASVVSSTQFVTPKIQPDYTTQVLTPLHAEQNKLQQDCAGQGGTLDGVTCVVPPPPPPQATGSCGDWMSAAGITDPTAILVINRESGCNPNAINAYSGACGIGQQLPCGKWPHQWNDPIGGLIDMQNYVFGRYGSWENAWANELAYGYY